MKTGSRGQFLCDECRQCLYGYHCSACSAAWRARATSRSQAKSHRNRKRRRQELRARAMPVNLIWCSVWLSVALGFVWPRMSAGFNP